MFVDVLISVLVQSSAYNANFLLGSSAHSLSKIFSLTIILSSAQLVLRYVQIPYPLESNVLNNLCHFLILTVLPSNLAFLKYGDAH
jgi:hypothetical protein